jgi:hypothetical protein
MIDWSTLSYRLTIPGLWVRQNSYTTIHSVVNNTNHENYSSVKDLLFRYICYYGVCVLYAEDKEAVPNDNMLKGQASHQLPIVSVAALVDMCHEIDYTAG